MPSATRSPAPTAPMVGNRPDAAKDPVHATGNLPEPDQYAHRSGLSSRSARLRQGHPVRALARAHLFTALRQLDGHHKGLAIQFLFEANLIGSHANAGINPILPVIPLNGADLTGLVLPKSNLAWAHLAVADISRRPARRLPDPRQPLRRQPDRRQPRPGRSLRGESIYGRHHRRQSRRQGPCAAPSSPPSSSTPTSPAPRACSSFPRLPQAAEAQHRPQVQRYKQRLRVPSTRLHYTVRLDQSTRCVRYAAGRTLWDSPIHARRHIGAVHQKEQGIR